MKRYGSLALGLLFLVGFWSMSLVSYLLFHTTVEITSMVISFCVFVLAWNLRKTMDNGYVLFLGLASLFVAITDLAHAVTYKGLGVFPGFGADPPTQFWIAGRIIQSGAILVAPFFIGRRLNVRSVMATLTIVTVVLCWAVFARVFPTCYIDGVGLTPFKKVSEYIVSIALAAGLFLLQRRRDAFDPGVAATLTWAIGLTIIGELAFTLYVGVYDEVNLLGHLIRLVSYYLLYRATVETGLTKPFNLLFRNLKQSEVALQHERNFVSGVLDAAGTLMVVTDTDGLIVRFNHACEDLSGYKESEVIGRRIWDVFSPEEERRLGPATIQQWMEGTGPSVVDSRWVLQDGSSRWISWTVSALRNAEGVVEYLVGAGLDVTERRQAEAELKEREARLRLMVESVKTGMFLIDRDTRAIVDANPAAAAMVGLAPEALVGQRCSAFLLCGGEGLCPFACEGEAPSQDCQLRTAEGSLLPVHRSAVSVVIDGRERYMESFIDISARKQLEEELRALSMIDELTGLYNRRGFMALAPKEMELAVRLGGSVALLFVDVNGLKEFNDTHGHAEGDRLLVTVGHILRAAFHETTVIARLGGDEFAVLAPQFVGARPSLLVNRLEQALEDYNATHGRSYEIRVSTGVARMQPDKPCSIHELLTQADTMMYVEKRRTAMIR